MGGQSGADMWQEAEAGVGTGVTALGPCGDSVEEA